MYLKTTEEIVKHIDESDLVNMHNEFDDLLDKTEQKLHSLNEYLNKVENQEMEPIQYYTKVSEGLETICQLITLYGDLGLESCKTSLSLEESKMYNQSACPDNYDLIDECKDNNQALVEQHSCRSGELSELLKNCCEL